MIKRKSDRPKAIEGSASESNIMPHGIDFRCSNCKERHYLVELANDNKNAFCKNCGHLTPLRILKYLRGISAPNIQQGSIVVQPSSDKAKASNRKPTSMRNITTDPAIQLIGTKSGIEIIDSQTNTTT